MASEAAGPTRKQLSYLRRLAEQTGTTFTPPATSAAASREIDRLRARPTTPAAERRRERRAVQDAMASHGPASSVRREETTGYASHGALGTRRPRGVTSMREPIDFAGAFLVEHADIASELTIAQWRQAQARERQASRPAEPEPRVNARGCGRS